MYAASWSCGFKVRILAWVKEQLEQPETRKWLLTILGQDVNSGGDVVRYGGQKWPGPPRSNRGR